MVDRIWLLIVLYNFSLFTLIGFSIWLSESLLPLLALIFSLRYSEKVY